MNNKKIFIGLTDIASQIGDLKYGFEKLGYETLTAVHNKHFVFEGSVIDYNLSDSIPENIREAEKSQIIKRTRRKIYTILNIKSLYEKAVEECDLFVFFWSSFRYSLRDYADLKKRGKKIVTFFAGDDIRWKPACDQEFTKYNLPLTEYGNPSINAKSLNQKLKYLRTVEKYADLIYSGPNLAQLALRPYKHFYVPLTFELFNEKNAQRKIPVIIHAATNMHYKGTRYVKEAVERLKKENVAFEIKYLSNIPYYEILKEYENADILIEQLLSPGGGKQSRELLACGKVVLTNMSFHYPQNFNENDCPIIDVNPDNLYEKLKMIILDYDKRVKLAAKGRKWVEKYHDSVSICRDLIDSVYSENSKPDYFPLFFRNEFLPDTDDYLKIYNKWTGFVKKCDWYEKYIPSGQRDGLVF